eukprot:SAG31_NODE_5781_length_2331_cov_1.138889_2_plen_139_part_00
MCLSTGTNLTALGDNGTYEATLFGDRAVSLIHAHEQKQQQQPLFLYLAFHNEHDPHQAPLQAVQGFPHISDDTYKVTAAMIETMDAQVGRVLTALSDAAMDDNLVIGFTSDNGGPLDHANNFPFRGGKVWLPAASIIY